MIEKRWDDISIWSFESFLKHTGITHFVSGRMGGISDPPYGSLNLALHVEDNSNAVLRNRELLASALGISLDHLTFAQQVHDSRIQIVTKGLRGSGAMEHQTALHATDGLITDIPGVCLIILVAVCVPFIVFDPKRKVVGVAHAGWRGTVRFIARNTVQVFQERFGASPADMIVGIGPSIGPCCYEVGPEVINHVEGVFGRGKGLIDRQARDGKGYFDLWEANRAQLLQTGIPEGSIEVSGICTHCNPNLFFSRRHQRGETGRFGAGIQLK